MVETVTRWNGIAPKLWYQTVFHFRTVKTKPTTPEQKKIRIRLYLKSCRERHVIANRLKPSNEWIKFCPRCRSRILSFGPLEAQSCKKWVPIWILGTRLIIGWPEAPLRNKEPVMMRSLLCLSCTFVYSLTDESMLSDITKRISKIDFIANVCAALVFIEIHFRKTTTCSFFEEPVWVQMNNGRDGDFSL